MQTKEFRTIDKSNWPRGPWDAEVDKRQWQDKKTELPCLIVRGPSGAWCGYVGVSRTHPLYECDYDSDIANEIDVHGGLTFASTCQPHASEESGICHVVESGEDDDVWWLGFDCAHAGDYCPSYAHLFGANIFKTGEYRTQRYVTSCVCHLASQLEEIGKIVVSKSVQTAD